MHTVTFPSVFGCNAFLKVSFSCAVYTKPHENDVGEQKRFIQLKRCQKNVFFVRNVMNLVVFAFCYRVNSKNGEIPVIIP